MSLNVAVLAIATSPPLLATIIAIIIIIEHSFEATKLHFAMYSSC